MAKDNTRQRPSVLEGEYLKRPDYVLCQGEKCRNAIAAWAVPKRLFGRVLCSRCLHKEKI